MQQNDKENWNWTSIEKIFGEHATYYFFHEILTYVSQQRQQNLRRYFLKFLNSIFFIKTFSTYKQFFYLLPTRKGFFAFQKYKKCVKVQIAKLWIIF